MLCKNVSKKERIARVVVGIALLCITPWTWFGLIGLVPLITGALGWCGIYQILGKKSCELPHAKSE